MRRWSVFLVVGIFAALTIPQAAFPQAATNEELLKMIQQLRGQIGSQQQKLEQLEGVLQQRGSEQAVGGAVKRVLQLQPPQALLGAPPMPPTAVKPAVGIFLDIEPQWIDFRGASFKYAAANFSGASSDQFRPVGKWAIVDVNRDFALGYSLGAYLPGGAGIISADFRHARNKDSSSFSHADGVVGPAPPEYFDSWDEANSARARNRVELDEFSAQYKYPMQMTRNFVLAPEVGLRIVRFENSVKVDFFGSCCTSTPDELAASLNRESESWGIGPKVGLTGTWGPFRGITLSVMGGGGWLLGETDSKYEFCRGEQFPFPGCGRAHNFNTDGEKVGFPFVEGKLLFTYTFPATHPLKGLSASVGYRLVNYFDLITRAQEVGDDGDPQQVIFKRANVLADSILLRLKYLF